MMAEAVQINRGGQMALSLSLLESLSFEEWTEVGRQLAETERRLQWWIGDWWAAGSHRYGERAKVAAEGIFGLGFQTLANAASVCRSFETSRRREVLSFSHHAEVAALPPEEADALLEKAHMECLSIRDLRREVAEIRAASLNRRNSTTNSPANDDDEELSADEIIIDLAESLGRYRSLTDQESLWLEHAMKRVDIAERAMNRGGRGHCARNPSYIKDDGLREIEDYKRKVEGSARLLQATMLYYERRATELGCSPTMAMQLEEVATRMNSE